MQNRQRKTEYVLTALIALVILGYLAVYTVIDFRGFARLCTSDMYEDTLVALSEHPDLDTDHSEHLIDYEYEYQYCLNIGFNEEGVEGRGDAIFLHCIGKLKPYTGGCVAMPEYAMKFVMQHVQPDCRIVIDLFENMGGSF